MNKLKNFELSNPLYYGIIWSKEFHDFKNNTLDEYRFKRTNKAKKYHKYTCKFWNNRLNVVIGEDYLTLEPFSIKDKEYITTDLRLSYSVIPREELEWYIDTLETIENAFNTNNPNIEIKQFEDFKLTNQYINNALEFEKERELDLKRVVFWGSKEDSVICLQDSSKDFLKRDYQITNEKSEKIYFDTGTLMLPLNLLKAIKKEMDNIKKDLA